MFTEKQLKSLGFYYSASNGQSETYTTKVTSEYSLDRFINNHLDFYKINAEEQIHKKKKIIIMVHLGQDREEKKVWAYLSNAGFELYLCLDMLIPINTTNLDLLDDIPYLTKKETQSRLSSFGLSYDETLLVDFDVLYQLVTIPYASFELVLNCSAMHKKDPNLLHDWLHCNFLTLQLDDFDFSDNYALLSPILANCFGLKLSIKFQLEELTTLLSLCHNLKLLSFYNLPSALRQLILPTSLEVIVFHCPISFCILEQWLAPCLQLKQLNIIQSSINTISEPQIGFPSTLTTLNINVHSGSLNDLDAWIKPCQQLIELTIQSLQKNKLTIMKPWRLPPTLEILNYTAVHMDCSHFQYMIKNCSKLKTLYLVYCNLNNTDNQSLDLPVNSLEKFTYKEDLKSPNDLVIRRSLADNLSRCSALKSLKTAHLWSNIHETIILSSTLEIIHLTETFFPEQFIQNLLSKANRLKAFTIIDVENLSDLRLPSSIKKIQLTSCNLTDKELSQLIPSDAEIQWLVLNQIILKRTDNHCRYPFANVQELILTSENLGEMGIKEILASCSQLKKLSLINCLKDEDEDEDIDLTDTSLPSSLQAMYCNKLQINLSKLEKYLSSCRQLQTLEFAECDIIDTPGTYSFPFQLQTLWINRPIRFSALQQLMRGASLKKLTIIGSDDDYIFIPDDLAFPTTLKTLTLEDMNFEVESLVQILKSLESIPLEELILDQVYLDEVSNLEKFDNSVRLPSSLKSLVSNCPLPYNSFFESCQALTSLELTDLDFNSIPQNYAFPASLTHLTLFKTTFSLLDLSYLLKSCQLDKLFLHGCQIYNSVKLLYNLATKTLQLTNPSIEIQDLNRLLGSCAVLTDLFISTRHRHLWSAVEDITIPSTLRKITYFSRNTATLNPLYETITAVCSEIISLEFKDESKDAESDSRLDASLDCDTNESESDSDTLNAEQIFEYKSNSTWPPVNMYRLSVFTDILLNEKEVRLTESSNATRSITLPLSDNVSDFYKKNYEDHPDYFLGQLPVFNFNRYFTLPSLEFYEQLTAIEMTPAADITAIYDDSTHLYQLKITNPSAARILLSFIIHAPNLKFTLDIPKMPLAYSMIHPIAFNPDGSMLYPSDLGALDPVEQFYTLISYCREFKAKTIDKSSPIDNLNTMLQEQAGSCRHRVMVFKALAKALNLPVQVSRSKIHDYVLIFIFGQWYPINLGGTPCKLDIQPIVQTSERKKALPLPFEAKIVEDLNPILPTLNPNNRFQPWNRVGSTASTWQEFIHTLMNHSKTLPKGRQNMLCYIPPDFEEAFYYHLLKESGKKVFYIHDLDEVDPIIAVVKDKQLVQQEADWKQFLTQENHHSILLFKWSSAPRHVGFNTVTELGKRCLKGIAIPPEMVVMILEKPGQIQSDSFDSRITSFHTLPATLSKELAIFPRLSPNTAHHTLTFYNDQWQTRLQGKLSFQTTGLAYSYSELLNLADTTPIAYKNAPWHLKEFRLRMIHLRHHQRLGMNGEQFSLLNPLLLDEAPLVISKDDAEWICPGDEKVDNLIILNASETVFNRLFTQLHSTDAHQPIEQPGFIAANQYTFLLTSELSLGQWTQLINEAKRCQIQIPLVIIPALLVPDTLRSRVSTLSSALENINEIIQSNDTRLCALDYQSSNTLFLFINEKTSNSDLIQMITPVRTEKGLIESHHKDCALMGLKEEQQQIIIQGNPSLELARELESLFLPDPYLCNNGKLISLPGELIWIAEHYPTAAFLPITQKNYKQDDILTALHDTYPDNAKAITRLWQLCEDFSKQSGHIFHYYSQYESLLKRYGNNPQRNALKSLLRLHPNYADLKPIAEAVWKRKKTKRSKALDPEQHRLNKVLRERQIAPFCFVTGDSGVGKSTFVTKTLSQHFIICAMDQMKDFLQVGAKPKVLYLGEVNLQTSEFFLPFYGLMNDEPSIFFQGDICPLPPGHFIWLDGNKGHFPNRIMAEFIKLFGNIITFKPYRPRYIKETILKPLLQSEKIDLSVADIMMRVYRRMNALTIRNLLAIALKLDPKQLMPSLCLALYDAVFSMFKNPEERKAYKAHLIDLCKLSPDAFKHYVSSIKNHLKCPSLNYSVVKTRQTPLRLLEEALRVRSKKIINPNLRALGVNGVLFEGASSAGKTTLAVAFLEANHIPFYHITPTDLTLVESILLKAYQEGAIVIIDEINTLFLEAILNRLLSGEPPTANPGFYVIAAQNAIDHPGRHRLTESFLNRFEFRLFKEYTEEEISLILKGMVKDPTPLIEEFKASEHYAKQCGLFPLPHLRQLFAAAKEEGEGCLKRKAEDAEWVENKKSRTNSYPNI